jgi:GTP-binding protein EngB required for normal cell division
MLTPFVPHLDVRDVPNVPSFLLSLRMLQDALNDKQQVIRLMSEVALSGRGDHMERALPGAGNDETASLRHYTLAKQEVVAAVRAAKQLFQAHGMREADEHCQALLVQLAEDRFNLAVVGQFKRGKSTLMNAVLGRDLLPTGLLPLTSAITTLCYGSTERVVLRRKEWTLEQEVPLAQLADYITERGNPGNEKGLIEAKVELPLPFLRRGLHFIDTPGIGSARHENTATTYAFLPQMDAVIFVTSVEAPMSEAEESFLSDIRGQVRQLFVVVNKMDMPGDTERKDVFGYIQTHMGRLLGTGDVHLYPLSARNGLTAKLNHDDAAIQRSGLTVFEQELTAFLAEAQGRTFLVSVLDRALYLLTSAEPAIATAPAGSEIKSHRSALELRQTMESLRASLLAGIPLSAVLRTADPPPADPHIIEQAIAAGRMPARTTGREQAHAHTRTCPVCVVQEQTLFAFFAKWQYTLATNITAQRAFAAERGLCPVHTWQFQEMASPQGISDGYAPLIETLAVEMSRLLERKGDSAAAHVASLLASAATCAACRLVRETAAEQVERLLTYLITAEGRADYISSAGFCLPHLQMALAYIEDNPGEASKHRAVVEFLLHEQVRRLEDLADDLRSYALKRDALRRGLLNQEEANAWRRALVQLVGERAARGGAIMADQGTV